MRETIPTTEQNTPSFSEEKEGDITKFICKLGDKEVGFISATSVDNHTYSVGGLFVDPLQRGKGLGSALVKCVNNFL